MAPAPLLNVGPTILFTSRLSTNLFNRWETSKMVFYGRFNMFQDTYITIFQVSVLAIADKDSL
jgi:hypothetical protein